MKFQLISSFLFLFIYCCNAWDLDQLLESSVPEQYSDSIDFARLAAAASQANASDLEDSSSESLKKSPLNSSSEGRVVLSAAAAPVKKDDKSNFSIQKNSTDDSVLIKSPKGEIKVTFTPTNGTKSTTDNKNGKDGKDGGVTVMNPPKNGKPSNSNGTSGSNNSGGSSKSSKSSDTGCSNGSNKSLDKKGKSFTFDADQKSDGPKINGGNSSSSSNDSKDKKSSGSAKGNDKSVKLSTDMPKIKGKPGSSSKSDGSKGNSTAKGNGNDKQSQAGNQSKTSSSNSTAENKNVVPPAPTLQLSNASLKYDKFSFNKSTDKPVELKTNGKGKPQTNQNDKNKPLGQTNSTLINKMSPKADAKKPDQKNQQSADKNKPANSTTTEQKRSRRSVDEIERLRFVSVFRKIGFWAYLTILGNVNVF